MDYPIEPGVWVTGIDAGTVAAVVYMPPYEGAPARPYMIHVIDDTAGIDLYPNGDWDEDHGEGVLADGSPAVTVNGAASIALATGVWMVYRRCPSAAVARDWVAVQIS